jgi:hypothetical protein
LGERLLCKQEVAGSIPAGSTESPCKSLILERERERERERLRLVGKSD